MKNINFREYIKLALRTLQLTFIILKLTKVINWSWWLVLLPTISVIGILGSSLLLLKFLVSIKIKQFIVKNHKDLYEDLVKYGKNNERTIALVVIKAVKEFLNKEEFVIFVIKAVKEFLNKEKLKNTK